MISRRSTRRRCSAPASRRSALCAIRRRRLAISSAYWASAGSGTSGSNTLATWASRSPRSAAALQALGGAMVVLATASAGKAAADTVKGLRPRGVLIEVGAPAEPIEVSSTDLLFASRRVEGALTGTPATGDVTLKFSILTGVAAIIETMPLEKAAEAYAKMMSGKARFRMVLAV